MSDRDSRFKYKCMQEWNRRQKEIKLNEAAELVQLFIKQTLVRYRKKQKMIGKIKFKSFTIKNVFIKGHLKPYAKAYSNNIKFTKAMPLMMKYIWRKFVFRCNHYNKLMNCSVIHKIRCKIIKRFLRKRFLIWKKHAKQASDTKAAFIIQKYYYKFAKRNRRQKIKQNMNNMLTKLAIKHGNKLSYYFLNLWFITKRYKVMQAYESVSNFTMKFLKRAKARNRWLKWGSNISKYENKFDILDILKAAKRSRVLNSMCKEIRQHRYRLYFDHFVKQSKLLKVMKLVKLLFGNFEQRKLKLTKLIMLRRWLKKSRALVNIDETILAGLEAIVRRRKIMNIKTMNSFMCYRNYLKLIVLVRAKWSFKRLKQQGGHKTNIQKFFERLQQADKQIEVDNRKLFLTQMYKLFYYSRLKKLCNKIDDVDKREFQPYYQKYFLKRIAELYYASSLYTYTEPQKERLNNREPSKLHFEGFAYSLDDTPKEKARSSEGEGFAATFLFGILSDRIKDRRRWSFNGIYAFDTMRKFAKTLVIKIKESYPTREFMDKLIAKYEYEKESPAKIARLKQMLRLYTLRMLFSKLKEVERMLRFRYFLNLCIMERSILDLKIQKKFIRRWHYKVTIKNVAREKMMKLYQNMHLQFLNMATDMFGEEGNGVFDQMNQLTDKFGSFTADDKSSEFYKNKFNKNKVKKRYVFEFPEIEEEALSERRSNSVKKDLELSKEEKLLSRTKTDIKDEKIKSARSDKKKASVKEEVVNTKDLSQKTMQPKSSKRKV